MKHQELLHLSLVQARDEIEHLTVTPSELLDAYLERLHEKEPAYNAYVTVHEEAARQAAEGLTALQAAGLPLGPLHGIPIALKDNIDLKGFRSTASSKIRSNHVASRDATVAARLKSAGAVIIGHTNMHEFAWGGTTDSPHFGASHNPWDLERYCAGSSGGSGAAVAGGTALGALGTDTGGSVRLPAAVNGIVGMRPTIGRVPNTGIIPCGWTMDTCGPMTRSVRDNAVMLGVIAGHDFKDPGCSEKCTCDYTADLELGVKHLRIGMIPQLMHRVSQPDVDAGVEEAANVFRSLGAEIVACRFDYLAHSELGGGKRLPPARHPGTARGLRRRCPHPAGCRRISARHLLPSGHAFAPMHHRGVSRQIPRSGRLFVPHHPLHRAQTQRALRR